VEIRERRVAQALLVAFILLIASNPLGRLIVGEDRYDQGVEAYLSNIDVSEGVMKAAGEFWHIEVVNHKSEPVRHEWFLLYGEMLLQRRIVQIDGGSRTQISVPADFQEVEGWITFWIQPSSVRLRWLDGGAGS